MFVAVQLPVVAREDLAEFLAPRQEAGRDLRWTLPEHWHVTLAFLPDVADRQLDGLLDGLGAAAHKRRAVRLRVAGGGAFPDVGRAKVLYAGFEAGAGIEESAAGSGARERDEAELGRLAAGARGAASSAGTVVHGGRFQPHLTLARMGRPVEATRWVRVLDGYRGPAWSAAEVALVGSHLGEGPRGRPRYEVVETFTVG